MAIIMQPWMWGGVVAVAALALLVGITWGEKIGRDKGYSIGLGDGLRMGWTLGHEGKAPPRTPQD